MQQDFLVAEAQDAEAVAGEPEVASLVVVITAVLAAVDLDHQAEPEAREVGDERPESDLPAEFEPFQPSAAQEGPELALRRGRLTPHRPCSLALQGRNQFVIRTLVGQDPSPSHPFGAGPSLSRKGRGNQTLMFQKNWTGDLIMPFTFSR